MNKDQKLLEEAYESIHKSTREPLYFGVEKDKEKWMKWLRMKKHNHKVHEDGSVSLKTKDVDLINKTLYGRLPFNFNQIEGNFVGINCDLTTLEGAPRYVTGNFRCSHNKLTSLKGSPEKVLGYFDCSTNPLTSLEGCPEFIGEEFYSDNFSDKDYRSFVKKRKHVEGKLSKELDVDLEDFS